MTVWDAGAEKDAGGTEGALSNFTATWWRSSSDGTRVVTGSRGTGTVKVWDNRTGAELLDLKGQPVVVESVAFSTYRARIIGSDGSSAKVWDVGTGTLLFELKGSRAGRGRSRPVVGRLAHRHRGVQEGRDGW